MKTFSIILAGTASALASAGDGFLGTKASPTMGPIQSDAGGAGFMSFLQMIIALGIVLALLKFVMPKLVTKLNKKIVTNVGGGIHIEESAAFAGGNLYIVRAKSKTLLLSVTAQGVNCLADLTTAPSAPEPESFGDLVDKEMSRPLPPFAVVEAPIDPAPDSQANEAAAALERLKRLAG
ncbi:MAG TPA: flagellar biosynthetic protein FliO [Fimbriimonadaceae bacterium]|nr:flagellar biosynthetic protein FliO [Fimbriimonadaceae bacterium]